MAVDCKPITFRLRPEGRSLYCVVNVWPNKRAMLAYFRDTRGRSFAAHNIDAAAQCCGTDVRKVHADGSMRKKGEFAEINCHLERLTPEIVAHETTHAALRWFQRLGIASVSGTGQDVCSDDEERFCYGLGVMVAQFSNALHKHKAWSK